MVTDVFFDFFGTLVDYNPSVHPAYNAPLAFARRAGRGHLRCRVLRALAGSLGPARSPCGEHRTRVPDARCGATVLALDRVSPAAHALECVTDLAGDHRLTIVTNTHDPGLVPGLVQRFGLDSAVGRVVPSVAVGWRKPHPAIFEAALRDRGAVAGDTVFVGDSWEADVEGPRRIGMRR
ncbi:MAG TPA: HAD family hydrolase [Trebonia sp.]|nr:HAD family hydrolase [Trebonia sp.]